MTGKTRVLSGVSTTDTARILARRPSEAPAIAPVQCAAWPGSTRRLERRRPACFAPGRAAPRRRRRRVLRARARAGRRGDADGVSRAPARRRARRSRSCRSTGRRRSTATPRPTVREAAPPAAAPRRRRVRRARDGSRRSRPRRPDRRLRPDPPRRAAARSAPRTPAGAARRRTSPASAVAALARARRRARRRSRAWLGPSIGPCCYEVGGEVAAQFAGDFVRAGCGGGYRLDLRAVNVAQLEAAGVPRAAHRGPPRLHEVRRRRLRELPAGRREGGPHDRPGRPAVRAVRRPPALEPDVADPHNRRKPTRIERSQGDSQEDS